MNFGEFKDKLFEMAKNEGLEECEIYYEEGDSFKVIVYNKEIDNYSVSTKKGLGFRAIYNGKMGHSYTEILDDEAVSMLVNRAKDNAAIIEDEDKEILYSGGGSYSKVESYNQELSGVREDSKINLALELESLALALDERVKRVQYCGIQTFEGKTIITNSRGLNLSHVSNGIAAVLIPVIKDGDSVNTAVAYKITRDMNSINPAEIAREAVENALSYIGAASIESGKYRVALRNDVASDLLDTFSGIFSADRVHKGLSLLKGKVGEMVGSNVLTIVDDPLMKDAMCSCPFDGEGVAAQTKNVISDGKLETLLYNLKTALKDGVETTGNASRGSYASPVDISPSNFYIKPGKKSYDEILDTLGDGLLITELQGLHSGANTVSGDFSLAAKGFLVEKGKIIRPVEQITVAGNFYSMLFNILETGNDLRFGMPSGGGCFGSPTILISELSVAGK